MNLYSTKELTDLLEKHGFFFKKKLGQNFLVNEAIVGRIADAAMEGACKEKKQLVVEIGPGAGALTLQLCRRFDRVLSIEIDPHLIPVITESLGEEDHLEIIHCDALKFDFSLLPQQFPDYEFSVCSNLPYYITSELIMRLLESKVNFRSVTVLIQKEAATRLVSKPGSSDYGAITAVVAYYAKAEKLFSVGPGNFIPKPKVDSTVLRLLPHKEKNVTPQNEALFFQVIHAAFANRRKTLANALFQGFHSHLDKEQILKILHLADVEPTCRGETLPLEVFARISDIISNFEEK